jgi:hypothetical protein
MSGLSRRTFLMAGAGTAFLAACGGSKANTSAPTTSASAAGGTTTTGAAGGSTSATTVKGGYVLFRFFDDGTLPPGSQRLPLGLGNSDGVLTSGGPATLTARIVDSKGKQVAGPITAKRHDKDLPRPYWPFELNLTTVGTYDVLVDLGGTTIDSAFSITDPTKIAIPSVGQKLIPLDTPTTDNHRGVEPICTRNPPCPLHQVTLRDAMTAGTPVAFIVATPAYCQTAACGPVLDVVLKRLAAFPTKITAVHAEVYTDSSLDTTTDAVNSYQLTFEPVLFLAGPDGVIKERLDSIFDGDELDAALQRLTS